MLAPLPTRRFASYEREIAQLGIRCTDRWGARTRSVLSGARPGSQRSARDVGDVGPANFGGELLRVELSAGDRPVAGQNSR